MSTTEFSFPSMSREQRNAVFACIAIISISFLNLSQLLASLGALNLTVGTEIAVLVGLMILSLISLVWSMRGRVERLPRRRGTNKPGVMRERLRVKYLWWALLT